ncbi:hypothetical protein C0991_009558 [Blastosporella zonata]|nr:hypothetical protein C0991_009558 [Blastosporella zonata]
MCCGERRAPELLRVPSECPEAQCEPQSGSSERCVSLILHQHNELTKDMLTAVNASDANIVFKSSDDVVFRIPRKNLEVQAAGFLSNIGKRGKIITLEEDGSTLARLFPYFYPGKNPDIELLPYEDLYKLAECAEKYQAFNVMSMCKTRLK